MTRIESSLSTLLQGASVIFLGTIIGQGIGLLGQIVIVRSLSPEEFGTIAFAFSIVSVLSGILVLGTPQGTARLIAANERKQEQSELIQSGLLIAFLGCGLGALVIYIFRFRIEEISNTPGLATVLSIFVLYLLISPAQRVLDGAMRGLKLPYERVIAKNLFGRLGAISLLLLLLIVEMSFIGAIVYWSLLPILISTAYLYFLLQKFSITNLGKIHFSSSSLVKMAAFSWPLALTGTFTLLISELDILMIGYFLSSNDVGLFRSIKPLKQVVLFFLTSFVYLYLPIATEHYKKKEFDELETLYRTSTKWIVTATFPIVLTMVLYPSDIIRILFTDSYTPASTAFAILMLGMFTRVIVGPNGATVQAIDKPRVEMYAGFGGLIANLLLNAFLIPLFGIEGAALATSISFLIFNTIELLILYTETEIIPVSMDTVIPLVPTTGVGIIVLSLSRNIYNNIYVIGLSMIVLSISHILSTVFTKSVTKMDIIILNQIEDRLPIQLGWLKSMLYEEEQK